MTDRELLEIIAVQVAKLTKDVDEIKVTLPTLATKGELEKIKNIVVRIENEHGQKLGALFDEYKLNSEKLDRIEKEVAKHEEFILRRIK